MSYKTCTTCGLEKRLTEYSHKVSAPDGYRSACKDCASKETRDWYAANKDRLKAKRLAKQEKVVEVVEEAKPKVPPRTHVYLNESYKPEPTYYRNNGNMHIKSIGWGC